MQRIRTIGLSLMTLVRLSGSLIANLDFLASADFLGRGFQTRGVELFERQRGQELKTASYLLGDSPEGP